MRKLTVEVEDDAAKYEFEQEDNDVSDEESEEEEEEVYGADQIVDDRAEPEFVIDNSEEDE